MLLWNFSASANPALQSCAARTDGRLVTAGGRVLSVTARGETLQEAVDRAYDAAQYISFEGMQYRRDIAQRGLKETNI